MEALDYLQTQLTVMVDHKDPTEREEVSIFVQTPIISLSVSVSLFMLMLLAYGEGDNSRLLSRWSQMGLQIYLFFKVAQAILPPECTYDYLVDTKKMKSK